MVGVTHIQVQVTLQADDGNSITLSSPVFKKDMRDGDLFPDIQIAAVIHQTCEKMAEMVVEKGWKKLFKSSLRRLRRKKRRDKDEDQGSDY
jgi:hypothetical protein